MGWHLTLSYLKSNKTTSSSANEITNIVFLAPELKANSIIASKFQTDLIFNIHWFSDNHGNDICHGKNWDITYQKSSNHDIWHFITTSKEQSHCRHCTLFEGISSLTFFSNISFTLVLDLNSFAYELTHVNITQQDTTKDNYTNIEHSLYHN